MSSQLPLIPGILEPGQSDALEARCQSCPHATCGAFNRALALESAPEEFADIDPDVVVRYAAIVAYKVFHNLANGHQMLPAADPITVDGRPAREVWAHHYGLPSGQAAE